MRWSGAALAGRLPPAVVLVAAHLEGDQLACHGLVQRLVTRGRRAPPCPLVVTRILEPEKRVEAASKQRVVAQRPRPPSRHTRSGAQPRHRVPAMPSPCGCEPPPAGGRSRRRPGTSSKTNAGVARTRTRLDDRRVFPRRLPHEPTLSYPATPENLALREVGVVAEQLGTLEETLTVRRRRTQTAAGAGPLRSAATGCPASAIAVCAEAIASGSRCSSVIGPCSRSRTSRSSAERRSRSRVRFGLMAKSVASIQTIPAGSRAERGSVPRPVDATIGPTDDSFEVRTKTSGAPNSILS